MQNPYEVLGESTRVTVWHKGLMDAWIDTADLPLIDAAVRGLWIANPARAPKGKFYTLAKVWNRETKTTTSVSMHRVILGLTNPSIEGHHIDNDGLNNRRKNLQAVSHIINMRERSPDRDWQWLDKAREDRDDYRKERQIAATIQAQFDLTRQGLWKIRTGQTAGSKAALAYIDAIEAEGLKQLHQMQEQRPKDGKWGIGTSGPLRAPSL